MSILFLIVLLGFSALALDLGRLYVLRTEMQNASDAAAMAAAVELDGRENARKDAVIAARQLFLADGRHRGRFSSEGELLNILKYEDSVAPTDPVGNAANAFEFYSWISAEYDDESPPTGCIHPMIDTNGDGTPDPGAGNGSGYDDTKCLATADYDAKYIRVKLYPELVIDENEYFQISLYLLPVLGLILEDGTAFTASTRVTSVAGAGGPVYCKYPPLFMCAYKEENPPENPNDYNPEIHYPGIGYGEEVMLRPQSASADWGPGNVGYLDVGEDIVITLDNGIDVRIEKHKDAMAASLGNEFVRRTCDPAIVSTLTGIDQQKTRKAFNTRFGLYDGKDGFDNAKKAFPPGPNSVDYPLDDEFNPFSYDGVTRKGSGWEGNTECLSLTPPTPPLCNFPSFPEGNRPETFNRTDYITYHHDGDPPPAVGSASMPDSSRYSLYLWELSNWPVHKPGLEILNTDHLASDQLECTKEDAGKKYCWLDSADAVDYPTGWVQSTADPNRRVLRVAVIKCDKYDIKGNTPDINLNPEAEGEPFPFHKFFLTQHAQDSSDARIFAEYVGPVQKEEEIDAIKHTVIQLYE